MKERDGLIKVEGLSKSYPTGFWRRRIRVLTDLSFTVTRNEIVGFLGPNGAGKTTTIKILNGLSRPEIARGSQRMLSRVGLDGAGRTAIRKYSKGMMQRLGLAQALLHEPELVILDEPMSGLDPVGRMEVRNLILELKASGKTVFFSSHIISDVEALCDRVIILLKGRKVAEGRVEELVGREGIRYVELLFSPVPDDGSLSRLGVPPEGATVRGNAFVLRAKDYDATNRWIERVREAGSLLRPCIPVKKQLEDIYVERVAGRRRADPPASDPGSR